MLGTKLLGPQPKPFHDPRAITLDQSVGTRDQPPHQPTMLLTLEIKHDRAAIAEQRIVRHPDHPHPLYTDHLRAMIGQHHRGERPRPEPGHLDDRQSCERPSHEPL